MYPITNGKTIMSLESGRLDVGGKKFYGLSSLGWKQELGGEDVYGNGPLPVGRTLGQYKASAEYEQLYSEHMAHLAKLGPAYGLKVFNLGAQWREASLHKVEIIAARITAKDIAAQQGGAPVRVKVTLSVIVPIIENGLTIIDQAIAQGLDVSPALLALNREAKGG
jgi:hypothetical protein